jgi:cytosine/creatinine deaminase
MLEVRRRVSAYMDVQLVAFPQDVWLRSNAADNVIRALDLGVDVIGGIPHFERAMAHGTQAVIMACELAAERGLRVDLHCDESDDPQSRHIETLAEQTHRLGLQGRVTGSHLTSMHSMDNYYAAKLIELIAQSGVSAIASLVILDAQSPFEALRRRPVRTHVISRGKVVATTSTPQTQLSLPG